ncbi:MAG: c-type cytochrome [Chloroflexi bacterium]|nr:c-type cytochrome [Chloroflexota bacterium]
MNKRYIVPAGGFAAILTLGFVLIVVVVIRPWGGTNISWGTHLNLTEEPIDDYTRNIQTFVSAEGSAPLGVWKRADCDSSTTVGSPSGYEGVDLPTCGGDPVVEWVAHGCAGCHGINGTGGAVGPNVQEVKVDEFSERVRFGANGMPAFDPADLSDEHVALLSEYLQSQWASNFPGGVIPTPTPEPTAVPTAIPTITPEATVGPVATPSAEPPSSDLFDLGKLVYEETAGNEGCDKCHGLDGTGSGTGEGAPDIRGASRSAVREALRGAFDMSDIKLTNEELAAVIEYLQFLNK